MPRKPRIEIAGYYHIINRGVEQRVVFQEREDYAYFEELMCFYAKSYGITIHNYCLMSNHYHLLIETYSSTAMSPASLKCGTIADLKLIQINLKQHHDKSM